MQGGYPFKPVDSIPYKFRRECTNDLELSKLDKSQ